MITKEQKIAIAKEVMTKMRLTKEQYIEMCKTIEELFLEPLPDDSEEQEISWEDLFDQIDTTNK